MDIIFSPFNIIGKEINWEWEDEQLLEHNIIFIEAITEAFPQFCLQCIIFKEFGIFKLIQIPKLFTPSINIILCCSKRYGFIKDKQNYWFFTMNNLKYCIVLVIPISSFFFQTSQFAFNKYLSRPESFMPAVLLHPCFSLTIGWIFHKFHNHIFINPSKYNIASRILKLPAMLYLQMILVIPALISYSTPTLWTTSDQKIGTLRVIRQPGDDKLFFYQLFPEVPGLQVNPGDCNLPDVSKLIIDMISVT